MLGSLTYSVAAPVRELTCYVEGVVRHYARRFAGVQRFELRPLASFRVGGEAKPIASWSVMGGDALTQLATN